VNNRRLYGLFMGIVLVSLLLLGVWLYGQSLTDGLSIQRFGANATAIAAIAGFLASVCLVLYTLDTRRLRKATEEQLEGGIKPVLLFEMASQDDRQLGEGMKFRTLCLKNIGPGPAFNIRVFPIVGDRVQVDFDEIALIESKDSKVLNWSIAQDGQRSGMSVRPALFMDLICKGRFPATMPITVECRGLSEKRYRTSHVLHYDAMATRVWTEFVRIEAATAK
jgi:hypothetical protein